MQCVLHIGPMKTGTTYLQKWFKSNRRLLARNGVVTPRQFRDIGNVDLVLAIKRMADGAALEPNLQEYLDHLFAEIKSAPAAARKFVISAEMLGQRLRNRKEIQILRDLLAPYFQDFAVVVYLRRQDEQTISQYSTALRHGKGVSILEDSIDYEKLLTRWVGVFGEDKVTPRIFERSSMPKGGLAEDFIVAIGAGWSADYKDPGQVNTSLAHVAQDFLAGLGRVADERGIPMRGPGYQAMRAIIDRHFAGAGLLPSRPEVLAFMQKYAASNEAVRARWFPARKTLFSEDYSKYPEARSPAPGDAELLDVAMLVTLELMAAFTKEGEPARPRRRPAPCRAAGAGRGPGR